MLLPYILVMVIIILLFGIDIHSEKRAVEYDNAGYYLYTLRLYYLGGSEEIKNIRIHAWDYPCIKDYKGSYWLQAGREEVKGVVRFEIIDKVKN